MPAPPPRSAKPALEGRNTRPGFPQPWSKQGACQSARRQRCPAGQRGSVGYAQQWSEASGGPLPNDAAASRRIGRVLSTCRIGSREHGRPLHACGASLGPPPITASANRIAPAASHTGISMIWTSPAEKQRSSSHSCERLAERPTLAKRFRSTPDDNCCLRNANRSLLPDAAEDCAGCRPGPHLEIVRMADSTATTRRRLRVPGTNGYRPNHIGPQPWRSTGSMGIATPVREPGPARFR